MTVSPLRSECLPHVRQRHVDVLGPGQVAAGAQEPVALGQDVEDAGAARRGLDLLRPIGLLFDTPLLALTTTFLPGGTTSAPIQLAISVLVPVAVGLAAVRRGGPVLGAIAILAATVGVATAIPLAPAVLRTAVLISPILVAAVLASSIVAGGLGALLASRRPVTLVGLVLVVVRRRLDGRCFGLSARDGRGAVALDPRGLRGVATVGRRGHDRIDQAGLP